MHGGNVHYILLLPGTKTPKVSSYHTWLKPNFCLCVAFFNVNVRRFIILIAVKEKTKSVNS
jgi:hypothetical protein